MKSCICIIIHLIIYAPSFSQLPGIQWQKCYGGGFSDGGQIVRQRTSGNYLIGGISNSSDGDVIGHHVDTFNYADYWVIETDAAGNLLWNRCYGGSNDDVLHDLQLTPDGGFIMVGYTASVDDDVTGLHDAVDIWVVKCDNIGNIEWEKCYGGTGDDLGQSIIIDKSGGYMVIGSTTSFDYDVIGHHYDIACGLCDDVWLIRLDTAGTILWSKCYGGGWGELGYTIIQTSDSGYIAAAMTRSDDGDVNGNHVGMGGSSNDYWIFKIDKNGNLLSQRCFGGSNDDWSDNTPKLISTLDNCYAFIACSKSNDSDLTSNYGFADLWFFKIDSNLNFVFKKSYGGSMPDIGSDAIQLQDSSFLIVGYTLSNDFDITFNHSFVSDIWLLRTDKNGNLLDQECLGGSDMDQAYSIQQTLDSGFIINGFTASTDGDVSGLHSATDVWAVKLASLPDVIVNYSTPALNFSCEFSSFQHSISLSFYADQKENVQVELLDITGKVLLKQQVKTSDGFNKQQFPVNLSKGVYLVRLTTARGAVSKKLIAD
jgi:hypothetical protein